MISMPFRSRHRKPGVKANIGNEKAEESNLEILTNRN